MRCLDAVSRSPGTHGDGASMASFPHSHAGIIGNARPDLKMRLQRKQLRTQIALTIASMSMHRAAIGVARSYMIVSNRCGAGARMNSSICTGSSVDAKETPLAQYL